MHYANTQLLTDRFHCPKRGTKKKQKSGTRAKRSRKPKAPKDPKPKRTPLTPEAKKERRRTGFKKRLEEAKSLDLCRDCREPAIEGQTRCEKCAERHRVRRRESDRSRRAAAKLREVKPAQEPVAASPVATAPQPGQQAEDRKAKPARHSRPPTARRENAFADNTPEGRKPGKSTRKSDARGSRRQVCVGSAADRPSPGYNLGPQTRRTREKPYLGNPERGFPPGQAVRPHCQAGAGAAQSR